MKSFDEIDYQSPPSAALERLRWIPLVLEDMAEYASEKGKQDIATEIEKCREAVGALLEHRGTVSSG